MAAWTVSSAGPRSEALAWCIDQFDELGTTIVLVEHDLDLVWGIADTITVLETGKVVANGAKADIDNHPAVRRLFIQPGHA